MHINIFLEIGKKLVRISSLHALVHVTNIDAPSHKPFQIDEYETFFGVFWSLLSHHVRCHQKKI
jgi:hypothetical protein